MSGFQLLESILWDREYALLPFHVQRLQSSAECFGFVADTARILSRLEANQQELGSGVRYKVRLLVDHLGAITLHNLPLQDGPPSGKIMLSPLRTSSQDRFLLHKTTRRKLYDEMHAHAERHGFEDVIFMNERNEITEGAVSNIFVETAGTLSTPPLACGVLPGVYRRHILETRRDAEERILHLEELRRADAIFICNAVRGIRRVRLVEDIVVRQYPGSP